MGESLIKHSLADEQRPIYPFTAIVAQDEVKMALILNAIDPSIGGILLTGPKGSGKSSIVRATAEIFPETDVVEDCIFGCNPFDQTRMCEECRGRFTKNGKLTKSQRKTRVVTLPLSVTEDRVIGSLDVETALSKGIKALQAGILAEANQNILYIDEVNLLPDHLIDMILDASASGWNTIEREGISITHPSSFILIGSMNPEEGKLRPQILDRFGLHVNARSLINVEERLEVIKRNEEFTKNPLAFREKFEHQQEELRKTILAARDILPKVEVSQSILESVAKVCTNLQVDGYRPDIVMVRAAKALAAFKNRGKVLAEDVSFASNLVLSHRTRKSGEKPPPTQKEIQKTLKATPIGREILDSTRGYLGRLEGLIPLNRVKQISPFIIIAGLVLLLSIFLTSFSSVDLLTYAFSQIFSSVALTLELVLTVALSSLIVYLLLKRPRKSVPQQILDLSRITASHVSEGRVMIIDDRGHQDSVRVPTVMKTTEPRNVTLERGTKVFENIPNPSKFTENLKTNQSPGEKTLRGKRYLVGKHAPVVTSLSRGRYVWYEFPKEKPWSIALEPTIRASAPFQQMRKAPGLAVSIKQEDLRIKVREYRAPFSIVILVDLSLSMVSSITNLGKAIASLHKNVYRLRDRVGLVVFKGNDAFILQEPTTNIELAVKKLWKTKASDLTPMAAGMVKAEKMLQLEKQRNKDSILMLIIISDGIVNIPLKTPLSKHGRKTIQSEAQADCIDAARRLVRDNIRTIVINTSHRPVEAQIHEVPYEYMKNIYISPGVLTPTEFLIELSKVSKGSYYGLILRDEDEISLSSTKRRLDDWLYFEERSGNEELLK